MIFHKNDFFIHFFRKYTFGRFPIDIAEKYSHIRIESITFPLAVQENFRPNTIKGRHAREANPISIKKAGSLQLFFIYGSRIPSGNQLSFDTYTLFYFS